VSSLLPDQRPSSAARAAAGPRHPQLRVDRVACTGHGMCASLLPRQVRLDEWGYPVVDDAAVPHDDGEAAIRFCPARALYWSQA
jgi:ferredoxin